MTITPWYGSTVPVAEKAGLKPLKAAMNFMDSWDWGAKDKNGCT